MRRLNLPDSAAPAAGEKRLAPSAMRNLEPIAAVLARHLPARGRVLELASGSGQHAAALAARHPGLDWQPSDIDPANLASIRAWAAEAQCANLRAPLQLDACVPGWAARLGHWQAIWLCNLLHLIAEAEAGVLLDEAALAVAPGGVLCLYGPFRRGGALVSDGDRAFDASLKAQDPMIGYKDIAWVEARLAAGGLMHEALHAMPANNLLLVMRRLA
ncbi:MAG: DUF938 domain-containing protein [Pararhodobacter sp.]